MVPNKFDTKDMTTSGEEIGDAEDDLIIVPPIKS